MATRPVSPFLRRARHLVAYWRDGRLIVEQYRSGARVAATPLALQLLDWFDRWRRPAGVVGAFPDELPDALAAEVGSLVECGLLDVSTTATRPDDDLWDAWDPAAGFLHFSSKDLRYRAPGIGRAILEARAAREPMPAIDKRYAGSTQIELPAPRRTGEFPRVLLERRTWRRFASAPVTLDNLATLLGLTCAIQYWVPLRGIGRLALKTYPSGGAHHPLEVYVLARRVDGLAPGLYHYVSGTHRLERIRRGATSRQIARYLPTQDWYGRAAALLLMTAVFPRTQWKYRHARAYKVVLAEAGHLCQNICLTATWLGLAPFCTMALADSLIESDLGIDGVTEAILYAAGVGARPAGVDWAPSPTRRKPKRKPGPLARY